MAGISPAFLELLRQQTDLRELASETVKLRRAGKDFVGRCPFHAEKTASFNITPEKNLFHCFGCKASGDAITFLEKLEGLSFLECVRILAQRAGLEVQYDGHADPEANRMRQFRERRLALLRYAARWYREQLGQSAEAHTLLAERGMTLGEAEQWGLGVAPAQGKSFVDALVREGFSPAEGEAAGLLMMHPDRPPYPLLRHRLVAPVEDVRELHVGFTGRYLDSEEARQARELETGKNIGKWMHSQGTDLFQKEHCLFGWKRSRKAHEQTRVALLCEGPWDVWAMHRVGYTGTVATYGCRLTEGQAKMLRRRVDTVILVRDPDVAGEASLEPDADLLMEHAFNVRIARLDPGYDPDKLLRERHGEARLRAAIDQALWWGEWKAELLVGLDDPMIPPQIRALGPRLRRCDEPERLCTIEALSFYTEKSKAEVQTYLRQGVEDALEEARMRQRFAGPGAGGRG